MKDPLVGSAFWQAYNGFSDSKKNGVKYSNMFEELLLSLSFKFSNKVSDLRYSEEERKELISDFEKEIPGSTGKGADKYFKGRNLKGVVATILEQDGAIDFNRQVSFAKVKS